jgi:hypothetical protein
MDVPKDDPMTDLQRLMAAVKTLGKLARKYTSRKFVGTPKKSSVPLESL